MLISTKLVLEPLFMNEVHKRLNLLDWGFTAWL